ncbi:MAG: hypothetical protein ACREJX_14245 [Polyangiaceae bacterium]
MFVLTTPQDVPHVVAIDSGVQQLVPSHTWPVGQPAGHEIVCPQLFVAFVLHFPEQAALLFGVQHVPFDSQKSPVVAHEPVPPAPQNTV